MGTNTVKACPECDKPSLRGHPTNPPARRWYCTNCCEHVEPVEREPRKSAIDIPTEAGCNGLAKKLVEMDPGDLGDDPRPPAAD